MIAVRNSDDIRSRYDYTYNLSRRGWAWEFLRRNPDFIKEAAKHASANQYLPCNRNIIIVQSAAGSNGALDWGLYYYPDPHKDGLNVDAFWTPEIYRRSIPLVLSQAPQGHVDEIYERTTRRCKAIYVARFSDDCEYMILVGQARTVQAVCSGVSFGSGERFQLSVGISEVMDIKQKFKIIDRASAVYEHADRDQCPSWSPREERLRDALIAIDCADAGMSLKDTACVLHGEAAVNEAWAGPSRAMKDGIRRLRAKGEALRCGSYRKLLAGPS